VVEVSLNLDLDILFSDPAPLEALLQRFGRVNRLGHRPPADVLVFDQIEQAFTRIYHPIQQVEQSIQLLREKTAPAAAGLELDEAELPAWLDEVYQGEVLQRWQSVFEQSAAEFEQNFLSGLLPLCSNPALAGQFNRLFNSVEVLPECLLDEYLQILESESPLLADQLLVTLGWGQYQGLLGQGMVTPGDAELPPVVRLPYDPLTGLSLPWGGEPSDNPTVTDEDF
jgi:CRISPR-associated endonuclease/helicase Cas3